MKKIRFALMWMLPTLTEYTCGPASVITLLRYYGRDGDEMTITTTIPTDSIPSMPNGSITCGTMPCCSGRSCDESVFWRHLSRNQVYSLPDASAVIPIRETLSFTVFFPAFILNVLSPSEVSRLLLRKNS